MPRRAGRSLVLTLGLLPVVAATGAALAPVPPGWVERFYSTGVYSWMQPVLTAFSNTWTFALLDVLLAIVIGGFGAWILGIVLSPRGRRATRAFRFAGWTTVVAALLYLAFLVTWGLNYRRQPLSAKLDYSRGRVTRESLLGLADRTIASLNRLHPSAPSGSAIGDELARAFTEVQRTLGAGRPAVPGNPKRTLLASYFRAAGIDGMTDPFFLEVIINDELLPIERPFIIAHEWAHLAGYADESEANFVGWLICQRAGAAEQYSAWLYLYPYVTRTLPEPERKMRWERLDEGPRQDLRAISDRLRRAVPRIRLTADAIYDRFLKANRVESGIESYGGVVDLLLGTAFAGESWIPELK